jgi:hypothetical protein
MRHFKIIAGSLLAFVACASNADSVDPLADLTVRAQGTISLGATHSPGSSTITPSVNVSFVPDTSTVLTGCGQTTTDTCTVTVAPDCSMLSCMAGQTCGWDGSCNAACIQQCTMTCPDQQQCVMASDNSMSCQAIQTFDAGPIVLSGTNMNVAVYPPYGWKSMDDGSPFVPGATISVQAAGPTNAGFVAFNQSFKATTLLEANPGLDQLQLSDVFGSSDLSLGWLPGSDVVYILASGAGGDARCLAPDAQGSFTLPRSVIAQVLGTSSMTANAISLSIQRMRLERHTGMKTVGSLDNATIQPQAWLDLITSSTESIALQACSNSETACGTKCVDTQSDSNNCGSCGNACSTSQTCSSGMCQQGTGGSCSSCQQGANTGACSSEYSQCTGECKSLLSCTVTCAGDTSCESNCLSEYSGDATAFESYWSCVCGSACSSECSTQCQ